MNGRPPLGLSAITNLSGLQFLCLTSWNYNTSCSHLSKVVVSIMTHYLKVWGLLQNCNTDQCNLLLLIWPLLSMIIYYTKHIHSLFFFSHIFLKTLKLILRPIFSCFSIWYWDALYNPWSIKFNWQHFFLNGIKHTERFASYLRFSKMYHFVL
jgi:hypothetical protein